MPPHSRTSEQLAEQRQTILREARTLAVESGWDAVTMRALSTRIGFSPPALYDHFSGKTDLLAAVAIAGFDEFAEALEQAHDAAGKRAMEAMAEAYGRFAQTEPALYELMFHRRLDFTFTSDATPPEARRAFAALRGAVVERIGHDKARHDVELITEAWWANLHGVVSLALVNRLRAGDEHTSRLLRTVTEQVINTIHNQKEQT